MFLIPTHVGNSGIHGTGCFTGVDIKKGDIIWEFHEGFDKAFTPEEVAAMPQSVRTYFDIYAYATKNPRRLVLCADHARFMNHQDKPNVLEHKDGSGRSVAAVDIPKGTELTCDYGEFDADMSHKLFGA